MINLLLNISVLAKSFSYLFVLSLIASLFPLSLGSPVWYLRIADSSVSNAPVLLVSITLSLLARFIQTEDYDSNRITQLVFRRLGFWAAFYVLLIPLQFVSYGWLWISSGTQLQQQISQASSRLDSLKQRIQSSRSEVNLSHEISSIAGLGVTQGDAFPSLKKEEMIKNLDTEFSRLKSNLNEQRDKILADLLPGTLRTVIGATILSVTLLTIRRHL
jgi:hypothetical protein